MRISLNNTDTVRGDLTCQIPHIHAIPQSFIKNFAKSRVCGHIWPDNRNIWHSNHESKDTVVALLFCMDQFFYMTDSTFTWSIREIADAVDLQCTAFDLHQIFFVSFFHVKNRDGNRRICIPV